MLGQVAESILESKGRGHVMGAGFREMGKEILKNKIGKIENQNIWSLGENVQNWKYFEEGQVIVCDNRTW